MATISAVITAPIGIEGCVHLDAVSAELSDQLLEIVVVDNSENYVDRSRPGLRHISKPGSTLQGLVAEGIFQAKGDWIWVSEDHARPLPGVLTAYQDAARMNPAIDLFSGATENLTSISPWSFANFLIGLSDFWPAIRQQSKGASNANLFVRRSAILPTEIAREGGFLYLTIPRLVAAGRHAHCVGANVDHVVHLANWSEAVAFQYHVATNGTMSRREAQPPRPMPVQLLRDFLAFGYNSTVLPWRIVSAIRGTPQYGLGTARRLAVLGIAVSAAILSTDIRRLLSGRRLEAPLGAVGRSPA